MMTTPFIEGWEFRSERDASFVPVTLPHDAMIGERRSADAPSWAHGGYFPGGRYHYRRAWTPGPEISGKEVLLRFEGVYRHSRVLLDGVEVGGARSGYREFEVRLDPHVASGAPHMVEVEVDNSELPNSRWYTGSGIYRPVSLQVRDVVHIEPGGVSVTTRLVGTTALVQVDVELSNPRTTAVDVTVSLSRGDSVVRAATTVDGVRARCELEIVDADVWSADSPARYELAVGLAVGGRETDSVSTAVGLRELKLDPNRGLLVNGAVVKLRGANIHHDNGVVGAATFRGSERRRVRILKEAGFNAIRSAHNPASRALLAASDELGMYVIDEAFDGWYDHKTDRDDAEYFADDWRDDVRSMVAKDRLHPSVIMYSIGNENGEALTPAGRAWASELVAELRRCDPTRLSTIGVNLVAAAFSGLAGSHAATDDSTLSKPAPDMTSTAINTISNRFGMLITGLPRLRAADRATRELFDLVDVAGYNYGSSRYRVDAKLHPRRLMVGTETMPGDLARNWHLVESLPTLLGDFVWAGWDYMGESGAGSWTYGTRRAPFMKPYPHLTSGMGIVDITGIPGAAIALARAAWGLLDGPAIMVRPLDVPAGPIAKSSWRSTDAIASWSWAGHEGDRADLEIYSDDEEVEVILNGRSLGRRPAGRNHGYVARFRTRYAPGVLQAVGYRGGRPTSFALLQTAEGARLRLGLDEDPIDSDVRHVLIQLMDDRGVVDTSASDVVDVAVVGPATLVGFGNAAPATTESFADATHSTYRGRALAVVRMSSHPDPVTVTATSRRHGQQSVSLPLTSPAMKAGALP